MISSARVAERSLVDDESINGMMMTLYPCTSNNKPYCRVRIPGNTTVFGSYRILE
jgi:hypothetical protein